MLIGCVEGAVCAPHKGTDFTDNCEKYFFIHLTLRLFPYNYLCINQLYKLLLY